MESNTTDTTLNPQAPMDLEAALRAVAPWIAQEARAWGIDSEYAEDVEEALLAILPEVRVPKPAAMTLELVRQEVVDRVIDWAREAGHCDTATKPLYRIFGHPGDQAPWFHSDGYTCDGFNREGYNADGYDRRGYNAQGYDDCGYDRYGYNKNGFNRYGHHRNGAQSPETVAGVTLHTLTQEQKLAALRILQTDETLNDA